jgi:hypothetical protein
MKDEIYRFSCLKTILWLIYFVFVCLFLYVSYIKKTIFWGDRRGYDRVVVCGFLTFYAISVYHHYRTFWAGILLRRGVLDTALCDKVWHRYAADRWFSPDSTSNKTDRQDITEILLKVALNTINQTKPISNSFISI